MRIDAESICHQHNIKQYILRYMHVLYILHMCGFIAYE